MHRRQVLAAAPPLLTTGCLDAVGSSNETPTGRGQPTETGGFSATVVELRNHYELSRSRPTDEDGVFRPTVSGDADCAAGTVTLDGWFATSSCRTIEVLSLASDASADRLTIGLVDAWNAESDPDEVDCAGITYNYRIRIETPTTGTADGGADPAIPATVRVRHRSRLDESTETFEVDTGGC